VIPVHTNPSVTLLEAPLELPLYDRHGHVDYLALAGRPDHAPIGHGESAEVAVPLPVRDQSGYAAREALQNGIAKQTGQNLGGRIMKDGSVTFGWFVRNRYYPLRDWRPETEKVKKIQIDRDLVEKFESVSLDAFEQFTLQKHLKHLATFLSEDRVKHARSYMKSIFAEAVEQDFLLKDPTRGIKVPRNLREKDKTTLTWHQLRAVLASVTARDRMLLTLEMTDALRPSELFALRWSSFDGSRLKITETVYKGKIRPFGKTKKSLGNVLLPKGMVEGLWLWKRECPDSSPDAFIFPNADGGFTDTGNYRNRVLTPLMEKLGLPKLNFQVLRRTMQRWRRARVG